jgi:hypothetical protein
LAVKAGEVATPETSVSAVLPPAKIPLGPPSGALKVTVTPDTGCPAAFLTIAASGAPNTVFTGALCGEPLLARIEAGTPEPEPGTVTVALTSGMKGRAPARITAVPGPTALTITTTVVKELPSG